MHTAPGFSMVIRQLVMIRINIRQHMKISYSSLKVCSGEPLEISNRKTIIIGFSFKIVNCPVKLCMHFA